MKIISHRFHSYLFLVTAILVVSVFATSSFAINIESKETKIAIEMDNFTISTTLSGEWEVTLDRSHQKVKLDQAINEGTRRASARGIMIREVGVSEMWSVQHSERWMADDYRRHEESNMIIRGEGMFKLTDLKKSETNIHGKHLYTMTYRQVLPKHIGLGFLYLYFPPAFDANQKFYVFLFFDFHPKNYPHDIMLTDFHAVVADFVLNIPSETP